MAEVTSEEFVPEANPTGDGGIIVPFYDERPTAEEIIDNDPKEKSDFLSQIARVGWAFQSIESDENSKHCLYKRRNFFAFINAGSKSRIDEILDAEKKTIEQEFRDNLAFVTTGIKSLIDGYEKKIEHARLIIDNEENKFAAIENDKILLKRHWDDLEKSYFYITEEISKTLHEKAGAKQDILGKWITEAKEKVDKVRKMSEDVVTAQQVGFDAIYEVTKGSRDDLKEQFIRLRDTCKSHLQKVDEILEKFAVEGITLWSSKLLYRFGFTGAIAAGWLFSVFVSKAQLTNADILSYLFNSLGEMTHNMPGNGYSRIWQWLGVLGIVTLASLGFRSLLVHARRNSILQKKDSEYNDLFFRVSTNAFQYTSKTRATGWSFFWFRVAPRFFVIGILLIFLSFYPGFQQKFSTLNTALFGLMIGSALAFGIGGLIYIYILKVIEPRNQRRNGWFYGHIELLLIILIFLGSFVMICIIPAPKNNSDTIWYSTTAVTLFVSASLLAGILLAYGLRYESLIRLKEELEEKIYEYNGNILRYSGVQKAYAPRELYDQINLTISGLLKKIEDRNTALSKRKMVTKYRFAKNAETKTGEEEIERRPIWVIFQQCYEWVIYRLKELLIPSENNHTVQAHRANSYKTTEADTGWDKEFFPDLEGKLESYAKDLQQTRQLMTDNEERQSNLGDNRYNPLARINSEINLWNSRIMGWTSEINKALLAREKGFAALTLKEGIARRQLEEAYQLSLLYHQISFGNQSGSPQIHPYDNN